MAIEQKKCSVCSADYYGSKNSKYCSQKCNQKAYRERNKPVYECAVNGNLGKRGKYFAMCGKIGCSTNICHSKEKCEHKVKQESK